MKIREIICNVFGCIIDTPMVIRQVLEEVHPRTVYNFERNMMEQTVSKSLYCKRCGRKYFQGMVESDDKFPTLSTNTQIVRDRSNG